MMPTLKITSEQDGKRLDVLLARVYRDYSRSFLQKWIREGRVTHKGKELIPNYRVQAGETIEVQNFDGPSPRSPRATALSPRRGDVDVASPRGEAARRAGEGPSPTVLFEDSAILVLNKPANLVVHPAPSHKGSTLVDWLEDYLGPKVTGLFADAGRLGVVHRLDKNTTGVLLVAKTVVAQHMISKQFQDRKVQKTYAAFIEGIPKAVSGIISAPVGRSHDVPSRMAVSSRGRPSETSFDVVESFQEVSQVSLHPKTGRTHQIRVHCAAIGHPVVGDRTYGSAAKWSKEHGIDRPLLHAEKIEFLHPVTRKKVRFEAPWPDDMRKALRMFRGAAQALILAGILLGGVLRAHAEDDAASTPAPVKHKTTHTGTGGSSATASSGSASAAKAMKRELASMHEQFKSMIEEVSALQDRVTGIQSSLDELGASRRLHDLEKAISDLNGKAVNTSNVSEETKTEVLDLARKLKAQQDAFDQLRDQIDRLRQELIQAKAHEEAPAPPAQGASR